jgi:hypothetical protein
MHRPRPGMRRVSSRPIAGSPCRDHATDDAKGRGRGSYTILEANGGSDVECWPAGKSAPGIDRITFRVAWGG